MNINGSNSSLFPRQPQGDQSRAVRRANNQIRQSCGGSRNAGGTASGGGPDNLFTSIQNLIAKLLEKLGGKTSPPPDEGVRGVYGAPIGEIIPPEDEGARGVYGGAVAPPPEDEGARGVYGGAIGYPPEDNAPPDGDVRAIYGAPVAVPAENVTTSGN